MRVKSKLLSVSLSLALMTCLCPGLALADSVESSDESIDAIALDAENNQESSELDKNDGTVKAMASTTTSIVLGKTYTGRVKDGDPQIYKFVVGKSSILRLRGKGDAYSSWSLLSSDGLSEINYISAEFNSVLNQAPINGDWYVNPGTYYLKASKSNYSYTNYSFSVAAEPTNVSFEEKQGGSDNNLYAANAIVSGKTYTGQISRDKFVNPKSNYDVDFYKLTQSAATRISISAFSQTVGLKCTVYDANGNTIDSARSLKNKITNRADVSLDVNVPKGASYIAIEPANSFGYDCEAARRESQGLYTFTVRDVNQSASATQSMYRLYNPNSGEHFYTANTSERDNLRRVGWVYEGVGWTAPKSSKTPVYRLYSGTDHHYTMDASERDMLKRAGWRYEGIGWYSDDAKGEPLYRQFNPNVQPTAPRNNSGSHNYTKDKSEHNRLVAIGWKGEGVGWYGVK